MKYNSLFTKIARAWDSAKALKTTTDAELLLDDLYNVGPVKPMGYIPCSTIEEFCGKKVSLLRDELRTRGMKTLHFASGEAKVFSGALYVWHEPTLAGILKKYETALIAVGLTTDCEDYVRKIATQDYLSNPVFGIIAETFGEPAGITFPRHLSVVKGRKPKTG